ncbi:glucosamine 6-phosphate N-acetyltransferase [Xylaria palmicola]|nr:glucosamine 6-phosphate N-acetyltransferase [Xylaria palmicola]
MAELQSLFAPSLISASVSEGLPDGFAIRPLARDDYGKGFYECLAVLTWVGEPTEEEFLERFEEMRAARDTYHFVVVEYEGRVVRTGCLVVEKKFIHNHGRCGHIEEIAVAKEHQGKGLGLAIMRALESVAVATGCYKTILDCGPRNEPFYGKCGFQNSGIEMSRYLEEGRDSYHRG